MTDERFTFIKDVREKNSTRTGARHKINGSKSKRCTLPSDHLTPAQIKRRNSPVQTVQLNRPMTYPEFKRLKPDTQYLYLDHLTREYKARRMDIVAMLGISQSFWAKLIPTIPGKLDFPKGKRNPSPEWLSFLGATPEPEGNLAAGEIITQEPTPASALVYDPAPDPAPDILAGSITLVATWAELQTQLAKLVDLDTSYTYTISFARK